jgi:hypothetical protein
MRDASDALNSVLEKIRQFEHQKNELSNWCEINYNNFN